MQAPGNLANPAYEPSDEDLAQLMADAFRGLAAARTQSLEEMRARILRLQEEALARFEEHRRQAG